MLGTVPPSDARTKCLHCTFLQTTGLLLFYVSYVSRRHLYNMYHVFELTGGGGGVGDDDEGETAA